MPILVVFQYDSKQCNYALTVYKSNLFVHMLCVKLAEHKISVIVELQCRLAKVIYIFLLNKKN